MKLPLRTLCVLFALSFTVSVHAATRSVTKTADTNDGNCDADCSLREAVAVAAPGDTIKFLPPLFDSAQTIVLGAEIVIGKNLTIAGPGANKLTIDAGPGLNRIFRITGGTVTLIGMTLTGGHVNAVLPGFDHRGGAILAEGATQLTLDGVQVTGNQAVVGGGVYLFGTMPVVIRNSTFAGNGTSEYGSAIFSGGSGTVTITNSTIQGNTAALAAAILNAGTGGMVIQNSTIAGNLGVDVGGIYTVSTLRLRSTIVAGNNGSYPDILVDTFGTVVSDGYNLIGDSAGESAKTNIAIAYQGSDIRDTDPQLGALAYNVGTTMVLTPAAGSPVIDKGNAFGQTTDQRGNSRIYDNPSVANAPAGGDGTDIGSVELPTTLAGDVALSGRVTNAFGRPIGGAEVTVQGGGVTRRVLTSQFGYYRISGLEAGEVYFITVKARRHSFQAATRTVTPQDNLAGLDFTARP